MTREELLNEPYLNKKQIERLLKVSREDAVRIYEQADQLDSQLPFRPYTKIVRMESVLKVTGKNYDLLLKQIKNAEALPKQSARYEGGS